MSEAYRLITAEKASYPVSLMCRVLGVNRTAFHAWERRPPSERDLQDAWLIEKIKQIHARARGVYGARRIEVFYNRERRHSTLGYLSPIEFEKDSPSIKMEEETS